MTISTESMTTRPMRTDPMTTRRARRARDTTRPRRDRPMLGVAVSVAALSAVTGVAAFAERGADRDAPVHGVVRPTRPAAEAGPPTELDVRGIPVWWPGAGPARDQAAAD
jgi:hypothetical protein